MCTNGLAYLRAVKLAVFVAATSLVLSMGALPARAVASIKIAIAYDIGGRGDHGINDSAAIGVDYIKKKYGLTALNVREMVTNGTESDRESRLQFLANANYNLIVAIGAQYAQAVSITALAFPSTQFALIDDSSVGNLNVSDMDFSNPQGAYLAGVLAGSATKTNKIGIVAPTAWAPNIPDFKKAVQHFCIHAGKQSMNLLLLSSFIFIYIIFNYTIYFIYIFMNKIKITNLKQ